MNNQDPHKQTAEASTNVDASSEARKDIVIEASKEKSETSGVFQSEVETPMAESGQVVPTKTTNEWRTESLDEVRGKLSRSHLPWFWQVGILLMVIAGLLCLPYWWFAIREVQFPQGQETVDVMVPPGAGLRTIARRTAEAGVNVSEDSFVLALRVSGQSSNIHAGRYRLTRGMTLSDIVDKFKSSQVESFSLRIVDGMTIWQLRQYLSSLSDVVQTMDRMTEADVLQRIGAKSHFENITSLEGLFAPETYRFNSGVRDVDVLNTIFRRQYKILMDCWEMRDPNIRLKTPYEALILASIIEKETGLHGDRGKISSVFHNRLKVRMPLQTDPTVIYGIGPSFNGNLTRQDLQTPSPYNTYRNYGLPPTPIAMPTRASIEAALHPEKTPYLYFVARGDGTTYFSKSLTEHNRAVQRFQIAPARQK